MCRMFVKYATTTEGTTIGARHPKSPWTSTLETPPPWPTISDHVHHVRPPGTSPPKLSATLCLRFVLLHSGPHPWMELPWQNRMDGLHCRPGASKTAPRTPYPGIRAPPTSVVGPGGTACKMDQREAVLVPRTLNVRVLGDAIIEPASGLAGRASAECTLRGGPMTQTSAWDHSC